MCVCQNLMDSRQHRASEWETIIPNTAIETVAETKYAIIEQVEAVTGTTSPLSITDINPHTRQLVHALSTRGESD